MPFNRSKKIMELVQAQNPAPETASEDNGHESVPTTEVTILGDITNKPENQRYSNVQEYFKILESASVGNENYLHNTTFVPDCIDERHSENSEVDLSDQDPTYEVPNTKKSQYQYIKVNQNHQVVPRILRRPRPHHLQDLPMIVPIQNPVMNRTKQKIT